MSDKAKHTPGPWIIEATPRSIAEDYVIRTEHSVVAAILPLYNEDETDANARLIAAAPELLEAAKEAREALQPFLTEEPAAEWTAARMLDAAIAKATGEA